MTKQTSDHVSSIAGRLMAKGRPDWMPEEDWPDWSAVLGSALAQDETPAGKTPMHEWDEDALSK